MLRSLSWSILLLCSAALSAQDPAAIAAREQKLAARAVVGLHAVADAYQAQKQHGRALALRRELLTDYADGDEKALDKCGFSKVGEQWRADPQKLVIEKDLTGDPKVLKKVDQEWAALQKELLAEHRAVAEAWTKLGDLGRAMPHWRRVVRFAPGDKRAAEALAAMRFDGFSGSEQELGFVRRARTIRGAVDWLLRKQFEIQKIEGRQHRLFEKAGLAHLGWRSEHYEVWGTLPESQLQQIALFAERALLLSHTLYGVSGGAPFAPNRQRHMLFVADDAAYGKVLDQCKDQFDADRLAFLKRDVDLAYLNVGEESVRFCKTNGSLDEALDQAVRGVVQDATGVYNEGLWEGIGHAACGFFFGRTLTFLLEQASARTVASSSSQLLMPDMATWKLIAEQSAWAKSDTRTSELVLISASRFTNEQRVKAWAICDYLFHWRPELLPELAACQTKDIKTPPEVESEFLRRTGLSLPAIDQQWRDFWGKNEALRKAMAVDPLGDPKGKERSVREGSRAIVDAVNEWRAAAMRGPVGWHFAEGGDAQAAIAYGDDLAKAELENQKKPKTPVPMPAKPAAIDRTVLWHRGSKPAEAVAAWASRPSFRDALLHPGRGLLGARQGKQALVLDVTDPVVPTKSGLPLCWPRHHQKLVPGTARASDLGPRAAAALAASGQPVGETVGMPLSLHFGRALDGKDLATVAAVVDAGGLRVQGVLVPYQGDGPDDDTAAGCVAFVPFQPLPSGVEVGVEWTVPANLLAKGERFPVVRFLVQ